MSARKGFSRVNANLFCNVFQCYSRMLNVEHLGAQELQPCR